MVTEAEAEKIYQRELKRVSRKFTHMRYHSFLMYFGVLKRLGWVGVTKRTEASTILENYPLAPERTYYDLPKRVLKPTMNFGLIHFLPCTRILDLDT
jgi:hypothetical protein